MIYLKTFEFPDREREISYLMGEKRTCFDSFYPFRVLSERSLTHLEFEPITLLYGGNGTGKTTVLNVIAEKLQLQRRAPFNSTNFLGDYLEMCFAEIMGSIPGNSKIITSDDVFDYMLDVRNLNQGIDSRRNELFEEYTKAKYSEFRFNSISDYEELKKANMAKNRSKSKFVRNQLMGNVREFSNGESAFKYFVGMIEDNGLYLLDEPENSLSPTRQQELVSFIEDSARFFGCQFIISTHSPFVLAMKDAKIYDLEDTPCRVKPWTELENVRTYYDFFKSHDSEFD